MHIAAAFEQAARGAFAILHNHFDFLPLTYTRLISTPLVTTVHGFSSDHILPVFHAYNPSTQLVAISASDRRTDLDYAATIHHGIPLEEFTFRPERGEYLLFFGRIEPIEVAQRTGQELILARINKVAEYLHTRVEPALGGQHVRYVASVGSAERDRLLGGARALLHLIIFDEPFWSVCD